MKPAEKFAAFTLYALSLWMGPAFAATIGPAATDHLVHGATRSVLEHREVQVIDDYGFFVTALLTDAQATALRSEGYVPVPIDHRTGRGSYFGHFRSGSVLIPEDLRAPEGTAYAIVQFRGPIKPEWFERLTAVGGVIYDYLPHHAALTKLTLQARGQLALMEEDWHVEPYHPAFKLSPDLPSSGLLDLLVTAYPDASLPVLLDALRAEGALPRRWFTNSREHVVQLEADAGLVKSIARLETVTWLEASPRKLCPTNAGSSALLQSGTIDSYPIHAEGVDGRSQIIGTCDSGIWTESVGPSDLSPFRWVKPKHAAHRDDLVPEILLNSDLAPEANAADHRKIKLFYTLRFDGEDGEEPVFYGDGADTSGHGSHVTGTIAGDNLTLNSRHSGDGVAFAAKLAICDITTNEGAYTYHPRPNIYHDRAYKAGARISSNSWGPVPIGVHGSPVYTLHSRLLDEYTRHQRPDYLLLYSNGNMGETPDTLKCDLDEVSTPHRYNANALAKNVVSVGSIGRDGETISSFSSHSGTFEGRIKPNVVAIGEDVYSSSNLSTAEYKTMSGTSMATPAVAGAAALIRDYFTRRFYPAGLNTTDPCAPRQGENDCELSSALLRAVLLVSVHEIANDRDDPAYPNTVQGWGKPVLQNALYFCANGSCPEDGRRLLVRDSDETKALTTGGPPWEARLDVDSSQPLRIMIAWTDEPAVSNARRALVNDLNLIVTSPGGVVYQGNPLATGVLSTTAAPCDHHNVEEGVFLPHPEEGIYTIRVGGIEVISKDGQTFALAATGDIAWRP